MFALLDAAFCSPTTPGAEGRGTDTYLKKGVAVQVFALKHQVEGTCIIVAITDTSPQNVAFSACAGLHLEEHCPFIGDQRHPERREVDGEVRGGLR